MDRDRGWQTVALTGAPVEHVQQEHTRNRRMARSRVALGAYTGAGER
jgi:hypothetical protein